MENKTFKKIIIALLVLGLLSLYLSYTFNACLMASFAKWRQHPIVLNENINLHYATSVRVVPLLVDNETFSDASPKYKFFREAGLRPYRQLPSALIIGVKKGGTRALLEFIRVHPDVRAAGNEVHFFDKNYANGFEWYRQHMPLTLEGQLTIEKTPSYFITKEAPHRVHLMNPSTKLLVVVRDPVTRAISDYTQAISKKPEMARFEQLTFVHRNTSSKLTRVVDTSWGPVKLGLYAKYLLRWLRYFPLSQFLFVSGERLVVDPAVELKRVQDFLGLKRVVSEKHFYFNSTKGFPCLFKSEGHGAPKCLGKTKGRNHPRIDTLVPFLSIHSYWLLARYGNMMAAWQRYDGLHDWTNYHRSRAGATNQSTRTGFQLDMGRFSRTLQAIMHHLNSLLNIIEMK